MFSSIKMEEYMESELSGIFWVKLVAKNIVLGSSGTHFMHMRVNKYSANQEVALISWFLQIYLPNYFRYHYICIIKIFILSVNRMDREKIIPKLVNSYCSAFFEAVLLKAVEFKTLKVHSCRFDDLPIWSRSCENNTLKISHSKS